MSQTVVRRFDLHVDGAKTLDEVRAGLLALVAEMRESQVKPVRGLSLLEVRLEGSPPAVSGVMAEVAKLDGVRIHHDRVDVAETTPRRRAHPDLAHRDLEYPDPRALLRIGCRARITTDDP